MSHTNIFSLIFIYIVKIKHSQTGTVFMMLRLFRLPVKCDLEKSHKVMQSSLISHHKIMASICLFLFCSEKKNIDWTHWELFKWIKCLFHMVIPFELWSQTFIQKQMYLHLKGVHSCIIKNMYRRYVYFVSWLLTAFFQGEN